MLGAALADETGSTAEREKRQFAAPEQMMTVPVPVAGLYEQLTTEGMFSHVPASAIIPASSRNIDVLRTDTEERADSEPIEMRQYYRPYGGYAGFRPYGPRPYGAYGPRPYGAYVPRPYGAYGPRPYGPSLINFSLYG